jgi:hypothetical protein
VDGHDEPHTLEDLTRRLSAALVFAVMAISPAVAAQRRPPHADPVANVESGL